jgi:cation diffusion facilitator family transporter
LRWAAVSLSVGIVLVAVKFLAFFLTRSNAIFSDGLEGIANVVTAGFAVYAIRLAHRPADSDHPYGHGKIEFFSAGLEGAMILLASVLIVGKVALSNLNHEPPKVQDLSSGLFLMSAALLVNGILGPTLWIVGRKHEALTLEAEGVHLIVDALDSVAVLVAIAIIWLTGWQWVDSAAALAVAAYIAILGLRLLKRSAAGLMDEQDSRDRELLRKILTSHTGPAGEEPRICSFHKLRHRHSGRYHWVDFHILVPAWWDIAKAHQVASAIEYEIELALGEGNATAHVEPCLDDQCLACEAARANVG